jgi:hypothetical protein
MGARQRALADKNGLVWIKLYPPQYSELIRGFLDLK